MEVTKNTKTTCELAIEILEQTNDGSNLDPKELKLLENAVNGFLSEKGEDAFRDLHKRVLSGTYRKSWFHDIEHLTIDHVGYVYWKGRQVEHYTLSWAYSQEAKEHALKLAEQCNRE